MKKHDSRDQQQDGKHRQCNAGRFGKMTGPFAEQIGPETEQDCPNRASAAGRQKKSGKRHLIGAGQKGDRPTQDGQKAAEKHHPRAIAEEKILTEFRPGR